MDGQKVNLERFGKEQFLLPPQVTPVLLEAAMKKFLAFFGKAGMSIILSLGILVLIIVIVVALDRTPPLSVVVATTSEATISPVPQTATAFQTPTATAPVSTSTVTPIPTTTPIPPGVTVDWIPTPIRVKDLPTPRPGMGHLMGRAICGSVPWEFQFVYLIWIDGDAYFILQSVLTDEEGRWFLGDLSPTMTYAISGEHPKSMPTQVFTVTANQINDLGDINLPPEVCE